MKETVGSCPVPSFTKQVGIIDGICQRCGAQTIPENIDSGGRQYCIECLQTGLIKSDTILYRFHRVITPKNHILERTFPMTKTQADASQFVISCLEKKISGFLNAVCGAGKTEILYDGLLLAMRNNWRVVIAIPRKDIVCELAIRLQTVFPHSIIKPLYEQAKDDYDADIVVSTIHQLIRYYQEFDWIVVDEADAFPLRGNAYLHRLIQKALKPGGTIFQMSATKSKEITKEIATGKILVHTIPSRFHQRALDCPQMIQVSNLNSSILKEKLLPKEIRLWLEAKKGKNKQTILFVPSIRFGTVLSEVLVKEGFLCKNVSSLSENGAEIIAHFRKSQILFLVSTTLLERGVTFKAIDCGVLGCDQSVFDFDCLVQICGRVGRAADFPNGEIVFFSEERTKAMVKALQYIKKMNQEARRKGLLTDEM